MKNLKKPLNEIELYNMLRIKVLFVRNRKNRYKDYLEQKYPYQPNKSSN